MTAYSVPKNAVILAGGKGTRLRPLTYEMPKALLPVHGKTLTEHLFDLFKRHGIKDIIISIGYLGEKIKDNFGDGLTFGVNITYIEEKIPLGTAGPLKKASSLLTDTSIVCNGDELKDVDLEKMYHVHKKNNALVTIALTKVEDPSQYGVARLKGAQILEFVEKPKKEQAPSNFINSGLYMMEPEVIAMIPDGFVMMEKEIFPKLAEQGRLYGYPFTGQWFDTGNMERYKKALKEWNGLK